MTVMVRDIHMRMVQNASALKRLLLAYEEVTLDVESQAHFQELLDEIGAREAAHSQALHGLFLEAHIECRIAPRERRQCPDRRTATATLDTR